MEDQLEQPPQHRPIISSDSLDIKSYASLYSGRTKISRLMFIAEKLDSESASLDAYRMAYDEIKKGENTVMFREVVQKINGRLGGSYGSDVAWMDSVDREAERRKEKLENELNAYRTNLIKESIRMGYNDFGDFYYAHGALGDAFKSYIRTRDYCTTAKHIIHMCLNAILVSIEIGQFSDVASYVNKAEENKADLDAITTAKLNCAAGLAFLEAKKYELAAQTFLDTAPELGNNYSEVIAAQDVATYGGLCALASFDRAELKAKVIDNINFSNFLELVPEVRKLVHDFYSSQYASCLDYLGNLKANLLLDIHLHDHVEMLYTRIRNRALVEYAHPIEAVDLDKMADAFKTTVPALQEELEVLITDNYLQYGQDEDIERVSVEASELERSNSQFNPFYQMKDNVVKHYLWLSKSLLELVEGHGERKADMSSKLADLERTYNDMSSSLKCKDDKVKELASKLETLQKELSSTKDAAAAAELELKAVIEDYKEKFDKERSSRIEIEKDVSQGENKCEAEQSRLSGTALAASLVTDGWSLVKTYEKYQQASEALREERLARKEADSVLDRVLHEIKEKADVILDERVEHERMLEAYDTLSEKLQHSFSDQRVLEISNQGLKAELKGQEHKYNLAQKENTDLQKQVTLLLKECRDIQLRCGGSSSYDSSVENQLNVISDNDDVFSERLLTFKDINGLVEQNAELRGLVRVLTDQIESKEVELKENFDISEVEKLDLQSQLEGAVKAESAAQETLRAERESFQTGQLTLVKDMSLLRERNALLMKEKEDICEKLRLFTDASKVEVQDLQGVIDTYKGEVGILQNMLGERENEVAACKVEIETQKNVLVKTVCELQEARVEIDERESKIKSSMQTEATLKAEADKHKGFLAEFVKEKDNLLKEKENLLKKSIELQHKLASC